MRCPTRRRRTRRRTRWNTGCGKRPSRTRRRIDRVRASGGVGHEPNAAAGRGRASRALGVPAVARARRTPASFGGPTARRAFLTYTRAESALVSALRIGRLRTRRLTRGPHEVRSVIRLYVDVRYGVRRRRSGRGLSGQDGDALQFDGHHDPAVEQESPGGTETDARAGQGGGGRYDRPVGVDEGRAAGGREEDHRAGPGRENPGAVHQADRRDVRGRRQSPQARADRSTEADPAPGARHHPLRLSGDPRVAEAGCGPGAQLPRGRREGEEGRGEGVGVRKVDSRGGGRRSGTRWSSGCPSGCAKC